VVASTVAHLAGERVRNVADHAVDLPRDLERGDVVQTALLDILERLRHDRKGRRLRLDLPLALRSLHDELQGALERLGEHPSLHLGGDGELHVDEDTVVRLEELLTLDGGERELKGKLGQPVGQLGSPLQLRDEVEQLYWPDGRVERLEQPDALR